MATKSTQTSKFDFAAFEDLTEKAPTGLKLWVAEKMLQDAQITMLRFKSPLLSDITDILSEVAALREANKKYLATRDNTTAATVDNPENKATSTTDVQTELDRVKQAKDAGNI